ncbi:MAG: hypothetical protein Q4E75_02480 [bacterium]|nr:hypothetical protein [bacterium]
MKKIVAMFLLIFFLTGCDYEDAYLDTLKESYKDSQLEKFFYLTITVILTITGLRTILKV